MSTPRQVLAAIFDMDGLPRSIPNRSGIALNAGRDGKFRRRRTRRHEVTRHAWAAHIDMVVDLWFAQQHRGTAPIARSDKQCCARAITRLSKRQRPLCRRLMRGPWRCVCKLPGAINWGLHLGIAAAYAGKSAHHV